MFKARRFFKNHHWSLMDSLHSQLLSSVHVLLCQASLPDDDSCAIYLIITVLFQVREEPPPWPRRMRWSWECWQALGLLFVFSKTSPPLELCVFLGIFQRLALEAAFACLAFMHHLHLGAAPGMGLQSQVWAPCRLSVITGSNCSAFPIASACCVPVYNLNTHPHPLAPFFLHFSTLALWPLDPVPETLTDFRWLSGTAKCPSKKSNKKRI